MSDSKGQLLTRMADAVGVSPVDYYGTVVRQLFPNKGANATKEEVIGLLHVAHTYGLDPFLKQIYAFPAQGGGIQPIVSVDGWYRLANAHEQYDGMSFEYAEDGSWVEATVHRKDRGHPISAREYLEECKRGTPAWKSSPRRMLRHRAACQAIRMAFSISGIMEADEAEAWQEREAQADVVDNPLSRAAKTDAPEPHDPGQVEPVMLEPEPNPQAESAADDLFGDDQPSYD